VPNGATADDSAEATDFSTRRPFAVHVALSLIALGLGIYAKASDELSDTGATAAFPLLCTLVLSYALLQALLVRNSQPELWLLNPAVQSALLLHFVPTAGALILPFLPEELQWAAGFDPFNDRWAIRYEWLNLVGAIALWTGYWSGIANALARVLASSNVLRRALRPGLALNLWVALALVLLSSGFRLLTIRLGLYGYAASLERRELAEAYSQYLAMAGELGKVVLVAVSLATFQGKASKWLLAVLLVGETLFGILSGFKSAVILPAIIVGLSAYAVRGRLPAIFAPTIVLGVFAAYALIEPFRDARFKELDFDSTSLSSIVDTFLASRDSVYDRGDPDGPVATTTSSVVLRVSDVVTAANGIEFAERWQVLPEGSPAVLEDILLSPLYGIVPRLLWEDKPINDVGVWYTQVVMGEGTTSSTAMYPVTYLNFAGGITAVIIGFLVVGVIQSALFRGIAAHSGALFLIVCLVGTLGHVDSVYYAFFVSLIRNVPLLFALNWLLFRRASRPEG
jgi:hypothetical protein